MNNIYSALNANELNVCNLRQELDLRVEKELIARKPGPDGLALYNYTNKCQFERAWDIFTMAARGLVLTSDDRIAAAPMGKFFNLGERPETCIEALPAESPVVTEKLDGSLIIAFWYDGWRCVTRGSWVSEQAKWAQAHLQQRQFSGDPTVTYQFELCAPWNRIVVHYAVDCLVLIAARNNDTFEEASYPTLVNMGFAHGFDVAPLKRVVSVAEIDLGDESVREREGYVARFSNGLRVKMKFATYLRLHRILTGLSVKSIWEALSTGVEPDLGEVPDEFMAWYTNQRDTLLRTYRQIEEKIEMHWEEVDTPDRKTLALRWAEHEPVVRAALFRRLDGKVFNDVIWKSLKPIGATATYQKDDSDAATKEETAK